MRFVTRDDVVSQRHKFGSAFLSYFSRESKIALFFNFLVSRACPEKLRDFFGSNFESRASQVELQKQKKDTASAKRGSCAQEAKVKAVL